MNRYLSSLLLIVGLCTPLFAAPRTGSWEHDRSSFNEDWRVLVQHRITGEATQAYEPAFDDSDWRQLSLPHDWGIEGPFDMNLPGATGKLPWRQQGWYRKTFTVPAEDKGKQIYLDIDGAMANAKVYLNGQEVGARPFGYIPFRVDLTDALKFGEDNVVAVYLDASKWGSRWYPGAGLYRNVWLTKTAPIHVGQWGVHVQTPEISEAQGVATFDVTLENKTAEASTVVVRTAVYEYGIHAVRGAQVAQSAPVTVTIPANAQAVASLQATVSNPLMWDIDDPQRYLSVTEVEIADKAVLDTFKQPFGFRSLEFTGRDGFRLNGRRVPIQGVCMHHDLGPIGTAFNWRAFERQMEIMKAMGVNALRTSHNPPAPEVLEICDRMGILVQVETFDCWRSGKSSSDYGSLFDAWHERDLRDTIVMSRNNPSVFMWCLGNEVRELNKPEGIEIVKKLNEIAKRYDTSRPTTVGSNSPNPSFTEFGKNVDVFGFNYHPKSYGRYLAYDTEDRPYHASETASTVSSRGEYFFPVFGDFKNHAKAGRPGEIRSKRNSNPQEIIDATGRNFHLTSYDTAAPGWASTPDYQFMLLDKYPSALGEFVWTGFDYIGEPTPYNKDMTNLLNFSDPKEREQMKRQLEELGKIKTPTRSSFFGIVDLCGFKKDRFYSYQARWRPELPMAHILPHWNWPERVGEVTPVHVYSSGDEAELFLNGVSLGRKKRGEFEYRFQWPDVVYEPGELKVVAYKDGQPWAEDVMRTTGAATQLIASADRTEIAADGYDLSFITVQVSDESGALVPRSHNTIQFSIEGPGEIIATGNGNPNSHESFQSLERKAFNGLALAIVRSEKGKHGEVIVTAESEGLEGGQVTLQLQ